MFILHFAYLGGCVCTQRTACLRAWKWYTRLKTVTYPSSTYNRARRGLTSFMRRTPLTTTPRRQPGGRCSVSISVCCEQREWNERGGQFSLVQFSYAVNKSLGPYSKLASKAS